MLLEFGREGVFIVHTDLHAADGNSACKSPPESTYCDMRRYLGICLVS